ncbi:multidrug effflux MFS transporter [Nocardiopsis coralli]|uniref:multidrug effflux MFS transporter n=1 Tax=Nocardiopsis coralli TaxID=2772213 RepID=UPI002E2BB3B4|nr:multidrug effflux MFS transporter [Nocardiopsis coralli]
MSTTQPDGRGTSNRGTRNRVPVGIVAALSGVALTGPLATDLYLPAFPQMAQDLGAPEARVQLTLTAMMVGMALGQLLLGPCSDALGRRRLLLSGIGVFAAVSFLCAVAPSAEVLVALRFLQGAAGAAGAVLSRAVVRDLYTGDDAARLFTRLMMVTSLAPVIGPPLGAQLLMVGPWQLCFVALGLLGLVNLVMVWSGIPETLPEDRRTPLRLGPLLGNIGRLLRDPRFLAPMFALGLSYAAMFTYISSFSFVSQNELGATPAQFGLIFPLNAAMLILANQINSVLIGRMGTPARLSIGLALGPAAVAALIALQVFGEPTLVSVAGVLLLLMFSMGFVFPNATTLALSEQSASVAGTGSALMGTMQFALGGGLSALAGLTATGGATLVSMTVVMAATGVLGTALFLLFRRFGA